MGKYTLKKIKPKVIVKILLVVTLIQAHFNTFFSLQFGTVGNFRLIALEVQDTYVLSLSFFTVPHSDALPMTISEENRCDRKAIYLPFNH